MSRDAQARIAEDIDGRSTPPVISCRTTMASGANTLVRAPASSSRFFTFSPV
jgi:hypothetical protein